MTSYERFKALCDAHGISVRQIGLKTGIDGGTFSHWKNGRYTPKIDKIQRIAEYFNVAPEFILEGKTENDLKKEREKMREEDKILAHLASQAEPEQVRMAITFLKTIMNE